MTNHLGYMARASSPEAAPPGERPCTGASLAVTGSAAGAGRTRLGRSYPCIADAPWRQTRQTGCGTPSARPSRHGRKWPRHHREGKFGGGHRRGRCSRAAGGLSLVRALSRLSAGCRSGTPPAGLSLPGQIPCPKGRAGAPRHSASPAARQAPRLSMPCAQPPPAQRASPDAAPAAWLPPSAQVRARRGGSGVAGGIGWGSRRAHTPTLRHSRAGGNPASRKARVALIRPGSPPAR
jgi:hypothetical protein